MYYRFGFALLLALAIAIVGVAIEKITLALRREVSSQHYQLDELRDQHARLRTRTQRLGAPGRMLQAIDEGRLDRKQPQPRTAKRESTTRRSLPIPQSQE